MSAPPSVSVVVPAYNAAAYIGETLLTVLAQSHADLEIIVVDDCSKDATRAIVAQIAQGDARVKLIALDRNRGAPAAPRNIGVHEARGEWIAFLDADDLWHPEKLTLQLDALRARNAEFCCTRMADFTDPAALKLSAAGADRIEHVGFWKQLIHSRTPTSSVLARKALLLRHPFNEDPRYRAREDLDCWLRCYEEVGGGIKLGAQLVGYRIIAGQISGSKYEMFRRHLFVLSRYRFRSGRRLGWAALPFTLSHFLLALYRRHVRRGM